MPVRDPCGICLKAVAKSHRAIYCDICSKWVHIKCNFIDQPTYENLKLSNETWYCLNCTKNIIPFSNVSNELLQLLIQGKNITNTSDNIDIENSKNSNFFNLLNQTNIEGNKNNTKCKYYTPSELNTIKIKHSDISMLHLNISSLGYHFDAFQTLLSIINLKPDFIGITETRHMKGKQPLVDTTLDKYNVVECPTESSKGGALLYI